MFMGNSLFRLGKFSSIILLKIFTGPLSWKSWFSHITIRPYVLSLDFWVGRWDLQLLSRGKHLRAHRAYDQWSCWDRSLPFWKQFASGIHAAPQPSVQRPFQKSVGLKAVRTQAYRPIGGTSSRETERPINTRDDQIAKVKCNNHTTRNQGYLATSEPSPPPQKVLDTATCQKRKSWI